jgi:hypothetical protein
MSMEIKGQVDLTISEGTTISMNKKDHVLLVVSYFLALFCLSFVLLKDYHKIKIVKPAMPSSKGVSHTKS